MSLQTFFDNFALLADAPNGVAKLRELVLHLAVEGKLASQDLNDEPAFELFKKVNKEKKRLIKEGKLNNKKPLTEIKDDEKVFELPENWIWVRLGDVVDQRLGKMLDKGKNKGKPYPYLRNTNVQWLRFDLSDVKEMRFEDSELEEYEVRPGDLLVCEGGEPGRCAIWGGQIEQIMFQKAIHRIRPFAGINSRFLLYRLLADAITGNLDKHFTGATIKHFTGQELSKYVIGLPPLEEQKRIVAKVDELMRLCDELEARQQARRSSRVRLNNATLAPLNYAASLTPEEFEQASAQLADNFAALYNSTETVSRLRSTILQLAVQGKLVPQDTHDEPASVLLEKIANEKQKLVKLKIIRSFPDVAVDTTLKELIPIPNNWKWSIILDVALLVTDGEHATPPRVDKPGIPLATAKNVRDEFLDLTITDYVSTETAEKCWKRCKPQHDDLLIVCVGATTGRLTLVKNPPPMVIVRSVALVRPFSQFIYPEFIALSIKSPLGQTQVWAKVKQSAQPCLYINRLQSICLPIPPLEEQKRIVAKVNQLMALCDELEAKLRQTEEVSEKLMKAAAQHVLSSINQASQGELLTVIA